MSDTPNNPQSVLAKVETTFGEPVWRMSDVIDNRNGWSVPGGRVMIADVTMPFVLGDPFPEPVQRALNAVQAARSWIHSNGTFFGLDGSAFVERIEITMPSPHGGFCEARLRLRYDA